MERTDLMVGENSNRLSARRLSRHRVDGESRQVLDVRMLRKGTALIRFANFPTIYSVSSNEAELRRYSRNLVGVPMDNRSPMTRPDVAYELPNWNEEFEQTQGVTPRTPPATAPVCRRD
jgi:hypothetical protein